jgi:hypothetical protein
MHKITSRALLVAVVAVTLLRPSAAHAANLWIAFEAGADRWRPQIEDFFACVTGATNFNSLLAGYGGAAVHLAGDDVVGPCGTNNQVCSSADVACVISNASFASMIQPGDVVLYINTGPCGGWNDHSLNVTIGGHSVPIHFGEVGQTFGGNALINCQTAAGMHEVYEAMTDGYSADCCNHQVSFHGSHPECAAPAGATGQELYGEYNLHGCAGQTFEAQTVSPSGHEFDLATCSQLSVDTTALCAQTRAVRDRGACMGGNVVRCSLGPTTEDCHGLGCSDTPTPHCNAFNAQCQLAFPATMCGGATAEVSVTCANTGAAAWDNVQIGSLPQGRDSLFADTSWISPRIAAGVSPSMVPTGAMGTFSFRIRAPEVLGAIPYSLSWALVQGGTYEAAPAPDLLTTSIMVAPCAPDAGTDAAVHPDGALGDGGDGGDGGGTLRMAGCGCRTVPSRSNWRGAAFLALGCALSRRRRRPLPGRQKADTDPS